MSPNSSLTVHLFLFFDTVKREASLQTIAINVYKCFPTMSLSVSVFVKQWPFMRGLDGSLSDSTITSSGEGGCRSFLISLREKY